MGEEKSKSAEAASSSGVVSSSVWPTVKPFFNGGAAEMLATCVVQPIDTIKVRIQLDSSPLPLTPDYGGPVVCYADGVFDSRFNRYVTVREDRREDHLNATTTIVSLNLNEHNIQEPAILVGGNDFYAFPRLDPKGERMAWIEWGHPNMPWDKSELWVGYFSENGDICKRTCVAGGDPAIVESPTEPKWSSEGELFFITDRGSGFWNIYKWVYPR